MITKGKEAKKKLLRGIDDIANVTKLTFGRKGKTVLIADDLRLGFSVTKDGVSVTRAYKNSDTIESCGADFVKNAAERTVDEASDGTTGTTILVQSMCNTMFNEIELGKNPNHLIQDLKSDLDLVRKYIQDNSMEIKKTEDIENIAKVSSNGDTEISDVIKKIYDEAGMNVEIDIVESDNDETTYEIVKGFTLRDTGFVSNSFINNYDKNRIEYENPKIYIFNGKLKNMSADLLNIFTSNSDRNSEDFRPLVIIVEDIEEAVLREIVIAVQNQMIHSVAVLQSNLIFEDRKNAFIDTSVVIDAEYSEDKFGKFGSCEKIIIEKDNVTFINGLGNVDKHIERLRKDKSRKEHIGHQRRIFALENKAAVIKVGGKLNSEIREKIDRVDDAVGAVKSAIEEGYCPGASSVLLSAHDELDLKTNVMKLALRAPYIQLMSNAEIEPLLYVTEIQNKGFGYGFNLSTEKVSNLIEDGIIDSCKVLRVSLENAVHTACNFALINATIE